MGTQPQDTKRLLGAELRGVADPVELVAWADQALVDGFDTPSLLRLSCMARTNRSEVRHDDVAPEFLRSLDELGVPIPSHETAIRWHMQELATQIYDGTLTPTAGLDRIHSEVIGPLRHPDDLRPWCTLWSRIDPSGNLVPEGSDSNATILALVASFLASTDGETVS